MCAEQKNDGPLQQKMYGSSSARTAEASKKAKLVEPPAGQPAVFKRGRGASEDDKAVMRWAAVEMELKCTFCKYYGLRPG